MLAVVHLLFELITQGSVFSHPGCKIFMFSDKKTIGLALIMDAIKASDTISINLSRRQKGVIVEASLRTTKKSSLLTTAFEVTFADLAE